jgi:hypothetical protein
VTDLKFEGGGVRFGTRFGEVSLSEWEAGFSYLEIPGLKIDLYGRNEDLVELARRLLDGKINERVIEALKSISDLDNEVQEKLLKKLPLTDPEEFVREVEAVITREKRYYAFQERGFEYFPASNQLLLSTGTLITFNDGGGAEVTGVSIRNCRKFISEGRIKDKGDATIIESFEVETLRKAARSSLLTRQQKELLAALPLIGRFSRAKQVRLLRLLAHGPLPPNVIEKLVKDINSIERAAQSRKRYEEAYFEFLERNCGIHNLHFHMNEKSRELLIHSYEDYWVARFLPLTLEPADDVVRLLTVDTKLSPTLVFGRWLVRGEWPTSKHFRMRERRFDDLKEEELQMLIHVAKRIPEPFRTHLQVKLVAVT